MAKKDCIKGSRVLRKLIPGEYFFRTGESPQDWIDQGKGGWQIVTADNAGEYAFYRTYFDISGWNREQLTAFITGVSYQESDSWVNPQLTLGSHPSVDTWDIISKSYLPDSIVDDQHWVVGSDLLGFNPPGMSSSNYDLEEIFDGRFRSFVNDANTANETRMINRTSWGTGDATAGDKIYVTRIIRLSSVQQAGGALSIPPMAIVIPAVVVEEKDLVYLERLRRSYVLGENRL